MSGTVVWPSPWLMCPPSFKGRDLYRPSDHSKVLNLKVSNIRKRKLNLRFGNLSLRGTVVAASPSPWLMCPRSFKDGDMTYNFYSPSDRKVVNLKENLLRKLDLRFGNLSMRGTVVEASPSPSPWLMCPPSFKDGEMTYNFYSPSDGKVVNLKENLLRKLDLNLGDKTTAIVGSSHGWLVLFNQRNLDLFLIDPLSGGHIKLPPIHTLPIDEENLSGGYGCVTKVIISSSPTQDPGCRAMMTFGPPDSVAFCDLRSNRWTPICQSDTGNYRNNNYHDIVYSRRDTAFFCISSDWRCWLEAWDVRDPGFAKRVMKVVFGADVTKETKAYPHSHRRNYVAVTDEGEILVVRRHVLIEGIVRSDGCFVHVTEIEELQGRINNFPNVCKFDRMGMINFPNKTIGFDVYKFDRKANRLRYMEGSLDGLTLFVGLNHSSVLQCPQLKPNSIYFTDDYDAREDYFVYGGHDIGIFNYEDKTISSCYYPCDYDGFKRIDPPPVWFFPNSE